MTTTVNENLSLLLLKVRENSVARVRPVLADYNLTEQQWRVIRILYRDAEATAQNLAKECCILSPSLSRILTRLQADGVVLRKIDSQDNRVVNLRLSAKGKRLHDKIAPHIEKQYVDLSEQLGKKNIDNLVSMLQRFEQKESQILEYE